LIINLTAFDLQYITMFAERQHAVKIATGATTKKHDKAKSEFELHYIGAMGEYAVSKHTGVPMNEDVHIGGDDGVDFVINGWECHVKTFTYTGPEPEFFIDSLDSFTAGVGIGTRVLSPTRVEITGCISRNRFESYCVEKTYGYGTRLMIPCHLLMDIDLLDNHDHPTEAAGSRQ
jgi:hypothetical protein